MSDICKHNVFVGEHSNGCPRCKEETIARLKQELNAAQADARALAEAANAVLEELDIIRKAQGNFLRVHSITHQELRDALSHHGAKYLEAQP